MTDALRGPYVRLRASMPRHRKLASLPSDAARWAFVASLCEAKTQTPPGEWANEAHFRACVTPSVARHLPALLSEALLEQDGDRIRIHDWASYQVDPTGTERSRLSRERNSDATETQRSCNGDATQPARARSRERAFTSQVSLSRERGVGGESDDLDTAERWLAAHGAGIGPGSRVETALAQLVDRHGAADVIAAFERLGPQDDAAQYVYGARNAMHPIPRPAPPDDVAPLPDVETLKAAAARRRAAGGES